MATKWKRFTRNKSTKLVAFVLAVLLSGGIVWSAGMLAFQLTANKFTPDILYDKHAWMYDYLEEEALRVSELYENLRANRTAETIQAGALVSDQDIVDELYADYLSEYDYSQDSTQEREERLTDKKLKKLHNAIESTVYREIGEYDLNEIQAFTSWLKDNRIAYTIEKGILIQQQMDEWRDQSLFADDDYLYYAASKKTGFLLTNVEGSRAEARKQIKDCPLVCEYDPESEKLSYVYTDSIAELVQQYDDESLRNDFVDIYDFDDNYVDSSYSAQYDNDGYDTDRADNAMPSDAVMLIGLRQEVLNQKMVIVDSVYRWSWGMLCAMAVGFVLLFLCCTILCSGAGRRSLDAPAQRTRFDRIWTEAQIVFVGIVFLYGGIAALILFRTGLNIHNRSDSHNAPFLLAAGVGCMVAALCLPCLLSQARRVKTRSFWEGFVCFRVLRWLVRQWKQGPRYMRVISLAILVPLVCIPWFTIPFVIAALLYFGVRQTKEMETVLDGVHRIRAGETGLHLAVKHDRDLVRLADDINGLSDGLSRAVDSAVKSERMKSELISNVSHDLKTPLTGIVTYVDLMQQLEPGDPKMQEYLSTVAQKTQRLSTLINDLLEASKASSGAMKLELTRVDFDALVQQACGEMQPKLDAAGLEIRHRTRGRTDVCADGRLLWRVLDNLLGNCARYAAPDSRVYTELRERDGFCVFTCKNISANELNIPADELMERFTRGDRARYTEGSGLGLSIAKSLTELMHGTFRLTVDGDLFKVEVAIPLWDDVWEKTKSLEPGFDPDATRKIG